MTSIALKYGATIGNVVNSFCDPDTKEEDARACLKMVAMQKDEGLQKMEKPRIFKPFESEQVNTRYCNVGNFEATKAYSNSGEVNITQRLEGKADANGILISYETYALAQDIVEVEERENLSLKGINRIVKCFAVKDRKPTKANKSSRLNINKKFKNKNVEKYKNSLEERIVKMEKNIKNIIQKLNKINL